MDLLFIGIVLWSLIHLIPSTLPDIKLKWVNALGENGYKGIFSLLIALSLVCLVLGWRSISPVYLYHLPAELRYISFVLIAVAFVLFVSSRLPTSIRQFIRHPQLTGVLIWAVAHLLVNGDNRSLLLFGGMAIWAVLEMIFINRREGLWQKAPPATVAQNIVVFVVGLAAFIAVLFAHPWLSGVAVF